MRRWSAIVALLVVGSVAVGAQTPSWRVDFAGAAMAEAWDFNESTESLVGVVAGAERPVWRALAIRVEAALLNVRQDGPDAWLRGFTVGPRVRWQVSRLHPYTDLGVGVSDATTDIPLRGTTFNFLLQGGGGLEIPLRDRLSLDVGARWFHMSNNGREGRHRNPDVQSIGGVVAIGWSY